MIETAIKLSIRRYLIVLLLIIIVINKINNRMWNDCAALFGFLLLSFWVYCFDEWEQLQLKIMRVLCKASALIHWLKKSQLGRHYSHSYVFCFIVVIPFNVTSYSLFDYSMKTTKPLYVWIFKTKKFHHVIESIELEPNTIQFQRENFNRIN